MSDFPRRLVNPSLCGALTVLSLLASCAGEGDAGAGGLQGGNALALARSPTVDRVEIVGPGCGDAYPGAIRISGLRDTFQNNFEDFVVSERGGSMARQTECTVSVVLSGEEGVAYAPSGLDLDVNTSTAATISTSGYWTSAPSRKSEDVTTSPSRGRYLTGALDDPTLWSGCHGIRELRFTIRLGLAERDGRAELERLRDLRFYARECSSAASESSDEATPDGGIPGDVGGLDANIPEVTLKDAETAHPSLDSGHEETASHGNTDAGTTADTRSGGATVSYASATGTGCDDSSTVVRIPEDRATFEIDFQSFASEATAERRIRTINCLVSVDVQVPEGKTVAVERFTARGSVSLPAGTIARIFASYDFAGASGMSATKELALAGPHGGSFELIAEFADDEQVFRPCGQARQLGFSLNVNTRLNEAASAPRARLESLGNVRFRVRDCP